MMTMTDDLLNTQMVIEEDMAKEAKVRQNRDNEKTDKRGEWSGSRTGTMYLKSLAPAFSQVVKEKVESYEPGKPGSNIRAIKTLAKCGIEPEVLSHLFVKTFLNTIPLSKGRRVSRSKLCGRVGDAIHDEMRVRFFSQEENRRNLLKKLCKQFDKRTYPREWRKRTIKNYFDAEQIEWTVWTDSEKVQIGQALMVWFRDSTNLIVAPNTSKFVDATPELLSHAEKLMEKRVLDYTLYKPMVVKPRPWSLANLFRGGYITSNVKVYPLVKRTGKKDVADMLSRDWSKIIPAINALQETPWRVNRTMLKVLSWAMLERGGNCAGLPHANDIPEPELPAGYGEDEKVTALHNLMCFEIHTQNRENKAKRQSVLATINVGNRFQNFEAIYYPHNLDSRGRAYPLPSFMTPQGPDYSKSLLEFSEGIPIETEEQACWIAIAGANAFGNDKVSLQQRADWVVDNEELILSIANDPISDIRWMDTSEPFMFLRFCLEWRDFLAEGFGFKSHMVCHVDATCSGLQHYSAALRDEVGGRSVNLMPGLPRQDIYGDVAERTIEKLMSITGGEELEIARNLIGLKIDRKITKRQVMVVPYAGTFQSCMSYTRAALKEHRFDKGIAPPWGVILNGMTDEEKKAIQERENKHIVMLSKFIWESISEVVVKGKEAMKWLSGAARSYAKLANTKPGAARSKAITWVTPDGFMVRHVEVDYKQKQVDTYLDGRVALTIYQATDRLSAQEMSTSVAPNFVHSLDANLLRAAVIKAQALPNPVRAFGMIHDSFGVHAARMPEFISTCVRPAFVEMYDRDVLADFWHRLTATTPELELENPPTQGNLDLNGVLESEFFFS